MHRLRARVAVVFGVRKLTILTLSYISSANNRQTDGFFRTLYKSRTRSLTTPTPGRQLAPLDPFVTRRWLSCFKVLVEKQGKSFGRRINVRRQVTYQEIVYGACLSLLLEQVRVPCGPNVCLFEATLWSIKSSVTVVELETLCTLRRSMFCHWVILPMQLPRCRPTSLALMKTIWIIKLIFH